ncbi:MAG: ABC transporter ATP-binding protein [Ignavibacteria bacterium]|jgi:branched-chain amino acid transport system ATP-binding protein
MLQIKNLNTGYGKKQIIYDLDMVVNEGEIVSIIGPNGAGKSTILKAVCGIIDIWNGDILFDNKSIKNNSTHENIQMGLTFSPQGNRVFDELTVRENLEIGGFHFPKTKLNQRIELILNLFPVLKERLKQEAGTLSGGEQQMLALGRALIPEPKLLLLDEPSLGLAPNLLNEVFENLKAINNKLNLAMLIVEQKVKEVLQISHRVYSIKLGKKAFQGFPEELTKEKLKEFFL